MLPAKPQTCASTHSWTDATAPDMATLQAAVRRVKLSCDERQSTTSHLMNRCGEPLEGLNRTLLLESDFFYELQPIKGHTLAASVRFGRTSELTRVLRCECNRGKHPFAQNLPG